MSRRCLKGRAELWVCGKKVDHADRVDGLPLAGHVGVDPADQNLTGGCDLWP